MKRFNQCVKVADIIKFSDQLEKDVDQFEGYKDKLFVQTQGAKELNFCDFCENFFTRRCYYVSQKARIAQKIFFEHELK